MAEQDKQEQKLNVEDALSLSEAYLIKTRKALSEVSLRLLLLLLLSLPTSIFI